jgi:hypothetical protein
LCQSVDGQKHSGWEHLVVVDLPRARLTKEQQDILTSIPPNPKRVFSYCEKRHNNYGHTCRHQIWDRTKGDYIFYVDDDDYLADGDVLQTLDSVVEPWAVFPVLRGGGIFFNLPPGFARTGTGMFIHKRDTGRWPDSNSYGADGVFIEELRRKWPYQAVESRPLVIQPKASLGIQNTENWFGDKLLKLGYRWHKVRNLFNPRISRVKSGAKSP